VPTAIVDALPVVPMATPGTGALHVPQALVCLALGAATAAVRRFVRAPRVRLAAAPVGAMAVSLVAIGSLGRGVLLPLAVAVLAVGGAFVAVALGGRGTVGTKVALSNWLLGATIAWFVFLSEPDTEAAVAALGLLVPLAALEVVAPRAVPAAQIGLEAGAVVALAVGAVLLGGADALSWHGWWVAKAAGAGVALAAFVLSPSGRAHRRPGPAPGRRG